MSPTRILAVTGNPVLHSKSPNMFNATFEVMQMDARYIRIAADSAKEAVLMMRSLQITGMNVTAPFKENMLSCIDEVDEEALAIGGVNTITNIDGKLKGYNTDQFGVAQSLLNAGVTLQDRKCVVIGAGGAGKAAAFGLIRHGAHVTIANRTVEKAKEAAQKFHCNYAGLDNLEQVLSEHDVVVFSLAQNINPIKPEWLKPHHVVFDANYKSSEFAGAARSKGCTIIEGLDWLLNQAIPSFHHYFGFMPDANAMKTGLSSYRLGEKKDIIALVGFMGCGKTTNGKRLAEKMGYLFVDTDDEIVKRAGMGIPEIFKVHGENYFRNLETEVLESIIHSAGKKVLSCGGGIVLHEKHRRVLSEHCLVMWLYASPEVTIARIKPGSRPLLDVENPIEKAYSILEERKVLYARVADIVLNTESRMPVEITTKLYEEISKTFGD